MLKARDDEVDHRADVPWSHSQLVLAEVHLRGLEAEDQSEDPSSWVQHGVPTMNSDHRHRWHC